MADNISSAAFAGDRNQGFQLAYNSGRVDVNYNIAQPAQGLRPRPCSTVPFWRDKDFIYRDMLVEIHVRCTQPAARVALVGLGGVGKSQLAVEYSYRVRDSSPETWVFWVHASSRARIEDGYRRIAEATRLSGWDDPKVNILQVVRAWLCDESNGRWVIIVDNADDSNMLSDLSGESSNGSVLITSRSREAAFKLVGEDEDILKVEPMSESNALALFRKKLKSKSHDDEVLELLRNLDYMPLAISQATAYIQQRAPRVTVSKYLRDFQRSEKDRTNLLNIDVPDRRRDRRSSNAILATWRISFEHIRTNQPSAAKLLSLMSFFDRQKIPEELITSRYGDDGTVGFEKDIEVLRNFSLVAIGIKSDIFEMHRLVQFATRKWLEQRQELEQWKETYIATMADAFPPATYENWKRCQTLFPHAALVLEYRPIDENILLQWTAVISKVAWYAQEQGNYEEAEPMNRQALDGREKVLGKEHLSTLTGVGNLASVLWYQGKHKEAEQMSRRALDGREKVLGKEHFSTLTSVGNLALVLQDQGKYEEAEQMTRRALDGRETILGKEHPDTLTSVYNLAYILHQQQKYWMAKTLYERALVGF
ncbi:MAG: hypothetical protein Q9167_003985 [Letrouitia subvulpina]